MSVRQQLNTAYGLSDALMNVPLLPIVANRAPTTNDMAALGTLWIYKAQNLAYALTSVVNNEATWELIVQGPNDFITFTAQTIGAAPVTMNAFGVPASSTLTINAQIIGTKDDFTLTFSNLVYGAFRRGAVGAPVLVSGTAPAYVEVEDAGTAATVDATLVVIGNNAVIQVTGAAGETWNWKAVVNGLVQP